MSIQWIPIPGTRSTRGMVDGVNRYFVYDSPARHRSRWVAWDAVGKRRIADACTEAAARAACEEAFPE